jgi:hypothetical protein
MNDPIKTVRLIRVEDVNPDGARGVLSFDSNIFCTLEPPWLDNQPNISCIPAGEYFCRKFISSIFGVTFMVENVPGRDSIICGHIGNTVDDTKGCVLLGESFGTVGGKNAVLQSAAAINRYRAATVSIQRFLLKIEWSTS